MFVNFNFDQGKFRPNPDWYGPGLEIGPGRVKIDRTIYGIDFGPRSTVDQH